MTANRREWNGFFVMDLLKARLTGVIQQRPASATYNGRKNRPVADKSKEQEK